MQEVENNKKKSMETLKKNKEAWERAETIRRQ